MLLQSPPKKTSGYCDVRSSAVYVDDYDNAKCSRHCSHLKRGWCDENFCANKNIAHRQTKTKLVDMNRTAACLDCYKDWSKCDDAK